MRGSIGCRRARDRAVVCNWSRASVAMIRRRIRSSCVETRFRYAEKQRERERELALRYRINRRHDREITSSRVSVYDVQSRPTSLLSRQ